MGRLDQFNVIDSFNESWYSRMMENFKNEPYVKDNFFVYNHVYNTIHVDDEHFDEVKKYNLDFIQYSFDRRDFFNVIEKTAIPADFDLPFNSVKYYADNFKNKLAGIHDLKIFVMELEQFCIVLQNKFNSLKEQGLDSFTESIHETQMSMEVVNYIPNEITINEAEETEYKNFIDSFSEMFIEYFTDYFQKQIFYYEKYYGLSISKVKSFKSNLSDYEIFNNACSLKIFNKNTISFNDLLNYSKIRISGPEFLELLFTNQNKIIDKGFSIKIEFDDTSILYKFLYSFKFNGFKFNGKAFFNNVNFNYLDSNSNAASVSYDAFKQHKADNKDNHTLPEIIDLIKKRKS